MDFSRQARVLAIIKKEPLLDKTQQMDLSHLDRFTLKLRVTRSKLIQRLQYQHKWDLDDYKVAHSTCSTDTRSTRTIEGDRTGYSVETLTSLFAVEGLARE